MVPRKPNLEHKKRTGTTLPKPNSSYMLSSNSTTNLHPTSINSDFISLDENLDSFIRRQFSPTSIQNLSSHPSSRPLMSHSSSLTTIGEPNISLTSHNICTEV